MKVLYIIPFCLLLVAGGWVCKAPPPSESPLLSLPLPLQERADEFYGQLRNMRLNSRSTIKNDEILAYFPDRQSFRDYITDLSYCLRDARFEDNRFTSYNIVEVSSNLEQGNIKIEVEFIGSYPDQILFWKNTLVLEQDWIRAQGLWYPSPPRY